MLKFEKPDYKVKEYIENDNYGKPLRFDQMCKLQSFDKISLTVH